jgi:hypothetical protein
MEITAIIASLVSVAIIVAVILNYKSKKVLTPKKSSSPGKQPNDNQVPPVEEPKNPGIDQL